MFEVNFFFYLSHINCTITQVARIDKSGGGGYNKNNHYI